ncbi:hypothetical protein [Terricaulis silvestris]|uniref:Uncharacterized protein n=1 Tax=Terricaulis silvestris TaxID=2686094 RepID=A0A6I6MUT6_9CAUL|nr:hypothetical protein [Terricaulis silvestris]QGZ96517.1 hypothetical protein DSM104635_03377 [Terricaulis silvestris]
MTRDPQDLIRRWPDGIEAIEVVATEKTSGVPTAVAGAVLFGGPGMVAGSILGRNEKRTVRVTYSDGRQDLKTVSAHECVELVKRHNQWLATKQEADRIAALTPEEQQAEAAAVEQSQERMTWCYLWTSLALLGLALAFRQNWTAWGAGVYFVLSALALLLPRLSDAAGRNAKGSKPEA